MDTLYIGMDLHKSTSSFCVMDGGGTIITERRVPTTPERVTAFITALGTQPRLVVALEPVSQWYLYADLLETLGVEVHLAHPRKLKAIAAATAKTDKLDARIIADHLRTNHLPEAYHAPAHVRAWKEIVRTRSALVQMRTQTKNRIHAILFKNGCTPPMRSLFTVRGIAWLRSRALAPHFTHAIATHLSVIESLNASIADTDRQISATVRETAAMTLLKTIPGIGDVLAATIMAEIGDIQRFAHPKQLHAYAGLAPRVRNSGEKSWHGPITKQGSAWLRYAAVEAVVCMARTRHDSDLKDYYRTVQANRNQQTATVATARKLLTIIWSVLRNERPFAARYPAI